MSVGKEKLAARLGCLQALAISVIVLTLVAMIDYHRFQSVGKEASRIITDMDGHTTALPFWPLGTEHHCTLTRPLTDAELERLKVIDTFVGPRHYFGVAFDCEMSESQLKAAQDALPHCTVFAVDQR